MHKEAFNRLPERFRKPTNERLYEVLYNGFNGIDETLDSIKASRNIDNAYGKTLDLMGQNVGQLRIDEDDELYRLLIKTRIIANLSIGDIPTMNEVLSILVKDTFIGLQEVWPHKEYMNEPAAIQVKFNTVVYAIPFEIINRIKAAGVRVLYQINYKHQMYVGSVSVAGEVITILPPPLKDIEIEQKAHTVSAFYTEHEVITIGKE